LELAQAYRRFGSHVTIIEAGPQLAGREDSDVAAAVLEMLRDEGIAVHLGAQVLRVEGPAAALKDQGTAPNSPCGCCRDREAIGDSAGHRWLDLPGGNPQPG
jgi:pyruvate/2-oxoglutarate dehydrogenase complex dihydrolipoamide dehydrogenase (E3) component